jgi:hypothetical protein
LRTGNNRGWEQGITEVGNMKQQRLGTGTGNKSGWEQGTYTGWVQGTTEAGKRIIDAEAGKQKCRLGKLAEVRPLGIKKDLFCTKTLEDLI